MEYHTAVLVKEVVDGTHDRRALLSALIFPLSSPIMIAVMMNFLADPTDLTGKIDIPVIGAEHAPMIVATLEDNGMNIVEAPENPKEAVRLGEEEVVISILKISMNVLNKTSLFILKLF